MSAASQETERVIEESRQAILALNQHLATLQSYVDYLRQTLVTSIPPDAKEGPDD